METYIALFRGINVGGNHMLPMKELKLLLEKNGCRDVRTYIQSGNVIFRSAPSNAVRLAARLTELVAKDYGFAPDVMVLTATELERAVAANPFGEARDNPAAVHLFFLRHAPARPDLQGCESLKTSERFALADRVFYLHTPHGFGASKLAGRAEKLLGVSATARNWRTVTTLLDMAKGRPG